MLNRKIIITIIAVCGSFILLSIIPYVVNFIHAGISKDPLAWGVFGDYLAGIVSPVIGIASLIVLGYLTVIMGKQGSEESRNLFMMQQKMVAYQDIAKHVKEINLMFFKLTQIQKNYLFITDTFPKEFILSSLLEINTDLQQLSYTFYDFYFTLSTFSIKYGHLFKYKVSSDEFKKLLNETNKVAIKMESMTNVVTEDPDKIKFPATIIDDKYRNLLADFLDNIRDELELSPAELNISET